MRYAEFQEAETLIRRKLQKIEGLLSAMVDSPPSRLSSLLAMRDLCKDLLIELHQPAEGEHT